MATEQPREQFGEILRQHRLAAGLSQEELAERAGLSRRPVSDLERGARRAPYPATLRRLADEERTDEPERTLKIMAILARADRDAFEASATF